MPNVQDFIKSLTQSIQGAGNAAKNAYFDVADNPNNTVGQTLDAIKPFNIPVGQMAKSMVFKPQSQADEEARLRSSDFKSLSPQDKQKLIENNMTLAMGTTSTPEEIKPPINIAPSGSQLIGDMRYNQGTFEPTNQSTINIPEADTGGPLIKPQLYSSSNIGQENLPEIQPSNSSLPEIKNPTNTGKPGSIKITLPADINGAAKEVIAQKAVDNIPGTTATEKYTNLQPRLKQLDQGIKAFNASNPIDVPVQNLRANYVDQVKHLIAPTGTLSGEAERMGMVTQDQADMMADNFIRQVELKAGINPPIDMANAQATLPIDQITAMKKAANEINGPLLDKRYAGNGLTPAEQIQIASRDALDKTISVVQPNIKQMSLEQSGIYDSVPSLNKARLTEMKSLSDNPPPSTLQKIIKTAKWPLTVAGLYEAHNLPNVVGSAAALGKSALSNLNEKVNGSSQFSSVSQDVNSMPSTQKFSVSTPLDDGSVVSEQEQGRRQGDLQAKIDQEQLNNPNAANSDLAQFHKNEQEYNAQGNIRKVATDTKNLLLSANNAVEAIQNADPSFLNALNQGFDQMSKASNGKYSKLAIDLENLQNLSNVNLSGAKNKESLLAAVDAIVSLQQSRLAAAQDQYSGVQVPPSAPEISPANTPPPDFHFFGDGGSSNLPPIQ